MTYGLSEHVLSEHELSILRSVLELWLDEYSYYKHAKDELLRVDYQETEQLARKLGWTPRDESWGIV